MKLTKTLYLDFMSKLTGHNKSFISKNLRISKRPLATVFIFKSGCIHYSTWLLNGRIYTQYFLDNECQGSWYHDFDTLDYDWQFTQQENKREF